MSAEIKEALKEILPFLKWHSPFDYKKEVLDHLLGMTGTSDGVSGLSKNHELVQSLIQLTLSDRSNDIKERTLKILVNITTIPLSKPILMELTKKENVDGLLMLTLDKTFPSANYAAMLLSNITKETVDCDVVLTLMEKNNEFSLSVLMDAFCDLKYNEYCELHHIGSLIANLTLLKKARSLLLDRSKDSIQRLLPFTQYAESGIRRYAVAAIIKNCLFETEFHEWLLSEDVELLTFLLLPLAGPEEFTSDENEELPLDLQYLPPDKKRESDPAIQVLLIESLFQLCATKTCRLQLKNSGTYYILRELHKTIAEGDTTGRELPLENTIQILIQEEPEEGKDNFREVEIPDHYAKHFAEQDAVATAVAVTTAT